MNDNQQPSFISRLMSLRILGVGLGVGAAFFVAGILFWGAFNTVMEATNTLEFCVSCHEMKDNVFPEYQKTIHYQNRSGVRATCSDCHVPNPWVYKFIRKIQASGELFHKAIGSVNTPEKFEAKRLSLAKRVWKTMKETDSRECRNCHLWDTMTEDKQQKRAWKNHQLAKQDSATCIDCHKGIAHRAVHTLLGEKDDPYDGKPDPRRLPAKDDKPQAAAAAPAPAEATPAPAPAAAPAPAPPPAATAAAPSGAASKIKWDAVPGKDIVLLYPGQSSYEWIYKGTDHGGARAIKKAQDRCIECHENDQATMSAKMIVGEKIEPTPIPGKRPTISVNLKAAHDGNNLYMRFVWPNGPHNPAPFAQGGKMDADNPIKLAVMFDGGKVGSADHMGCWVTCHNDSRSMPGAPKKEAYGDLAKRLDLSDGPTKYLKETRTEIEMDGSPDKPRGGWNKLKPAAEIDALKAAGQMMDLVRFKSGKGGVSEAGFVLEQRVMTGGQPTAFEGKLDGANWVVTMTRPLKASVPGAVSFAPGTQYTMGFAIHDDHTNARFHHVSLEYKLGLDDASAQINAVKQ